MSKIVTICCISDLHTYHRQVNVQKCDLLLVSGDLVFRAEVGVLYDFDMWCKELKAKGIIKEAVVTAGNHDAILDPKSMYYYHNLRGIFQNFIYLQHEAAEVMGLKIFASPYSCEFCNWFFAYKRGPEGEYMWSQIPDDTQILITHGPPAGIGDFLQPNQNVQHPKDITNWDFIARVGCEDLKKRVKQLKDLKLHVFGHIHFCHGIYDIKGNRRKQLKLSAHRAKRGPVFVNASTCTEQYKPTNKPIIIELEVD